MAREADNEKGAETPIEEPAARQSLRRRSAPHTVRVLFLTSVLFPLVFGAVLLLSLIEREVDAPSWIAKRVASETSLMLGGGGLEFDGMTITFGRDLHPKIAMRQVELRDAEGAVIVRVPKVEVVVSPRGIVFARSILVQQVNLTGMQILVRRESDGGIAVSFEMGAGTVGQAPSFAALLDQLDASFARPAISALEFVRADGLIINYEDVQSGRSWTLDGGQVALENANDGLSLRLRAALLSGRSYVSEIALQFTSNFDEGERLISVDLRDVVATDLSTQLAALSWLDVLDAPLSGTLRTSINQAGKLGALNATLDIGAGVVRAAGSGRTVPFDSAKAYLTYLPDENRIVFDSLTARSPFGGIVATGSAQLENVSGALPEEILGTLEISELTLPTTVLWEEPPVIDGATAAFRLKLRPFALEVGRYSVTSEGTTLTGGVELEARQEGWSVAVDVDTPFVSRGKAMSLWPERFLPMTRRWLDRNILQGTAEGFALRLRKHPNERIDVGMSFDFHSASLRPLNHLPVIENARGRVALLDGAISVGVDKASMISSSGGQVELGEGGFFIENIFESPATANLEFSVAGTATAVLTILDEPPWAYVDRAGLAPDVVDGIAEGRVKVAFPLKAPPFNAGDISIDVDATVANVTSTAIVPGRTLASSLLDVSIEGGVLAIGGPARLDGIPLRLDISSVLSGGAPPKIYAAFDITPQTLDALNIRLDGIDVQGSARAQLEILQEDGRRRAVVISDLVGLSLDAPALIWRKPSEAPGMLEVEIALDQPAMSVPRILFEANGVRLDGAAQALENGTTEIVFANARMADVGETSLTIEAGAGDAPPKIRASGGWFDLQHFLQDRAPVDTGPTPPMDIAVNELWVTNEIYLGDFRGELLGGRGLSGQFTGRLNGDARIQGTVAPANGGSSISIQANDAGRVIMAMGLLDEASGGNLSVRLLPGQDGARFEGTAQISDLWVQSAPVLAEMLNAISVVGLLQQMGGQGILFSEVDGQFTIWSDRIDVHQPSNAIGPGLGLSMDGVYLTDSGAMDFQGVVSPLYLVNGLGSILARPGEGLIGFNYHLYGPEGDRTVGINPLSILTPGIFRDLFRSPSATTDQP